MHLFELVPPLLAPFATVIQTSALMLQSSAHRESWILCGPSGSVSQLLFSFSPRNTAPNVLPLLAQLPNILFPDWLRAWSGDTRLTFHPLDSHLIIRFSPLLLNGRLGGRGCFGWNLTRHRWFYQLRVLWFLVAARQLLVFSQFFQGWRRRRRGRKGQ